MPDIETAYDDDPRVLPTASGGLTFTRTGTVYYLRPVDAAEAFRQALEAGLADATDHALYAGACWWCVVNADGTSRVLYRTPDEALGFFLGAPQSALVAAS